MFITISDEILGNFGGYTGEVVHKTRTGYWTEIMDTCQFDKASNQVIEWLDDNAARGIRESALFHFFYVCHTPRYSVFVTLEDIAKGLAILQN